MLRRKGLYSLDRIVYLFVHLNTREKIQTNYNTLTKQLSPFPNDSEEIISYSNFIFSKISSEYFLCFTRCPCKV